MKAIKDIFGDLRQLGMVFALLALVILFQVFTGGKVLTPTNLMNLVNGNAHILILAVGMVMVIIAGHIDLSVGSVAAVAGIAVALAMRDLHLPWWLGILLGLVIGIAIGVWNGFWVAYVGIPAFIVTLAGMMLFRGLNQWIGKSNSIPVPRDYQMIGNGYLPDLGGGGLYNIPTLILGALLIAALIWMELHGRARDRQLGATNPPLWTAIVRLVLVCAVIVYLTLQFAGGRKGTSFPIPGLILAALVILYTIITQRTIFGRHVYAVGGNLRAAELSGVRTKRTNFFVMVNMSMLAALAGMVFVARSTASGPFDGKDWELDAIAACFIGGAAVAGWVGTVTGAMIGGLVMAVLNNGLQLLGAGADATQMIKGLVLLAAVAFDVYNKRAGRPSIIGHLTRQKPANDSTSLATTAATEPDGTPAA